MVFSVTTVLGLIWAASPASARTSSDEPVQTSLVRYDEDWSVLARPDARTGRWVEPLKYIPVGDDVWLTTGLEVRFRNETYRAFQWGDAPDQADRWVRALPFADLHVGQVRVFVQPVAAFADGVRPSESPVDQTGVDLLQGFAETSADLNAATRVIVRAGRQMAPLGSQRLVGARYGPNLPLAFDGVRVITHRGDAELSVFAFRPVQAGPHDFDDSRSGRKALWGAYLTLPELDLYYLGFENINAAFASAAGAEHRDSFGARLHGSRSDWRWNIEGVAQFGRLGETRIFAWTLANEIGRHFDSRPTPIDATLRLDIVSGDRNPSDGRLGTFNALFPKGQYFGELSPVGPANIIHLSPQISTRLTPRLTLGVAAMAYWRQSLADGVYDIPGALIRAPDGSTARFIGRQAETILTWQATPEWALSGSASVFSPGRYIRETGPARTILMFGLESNFRF